jgi:TonB family protein
MRLGLHGETREPRTSRKPLSVTASLFLHGGVFFLLMEAPPIDVPPRSPSEYKQAIEGNESRLVWYKLPEKLPNVNSEAPRREKQPLKAQNRAKQSIVSSPPNAAKAPQMVWTEAPAIETAPLDSANIVAVLEHPLPPKPFAAPADAVRPPAPEITMPNAPEIAATPPEPVQLPNKLPGRTYVPPVLKARDVRAIDVPVDAPQLDVTPIRTPSPLAVKLPPRPFAAPRAGSAAPAKEIVQAGDAPAIPAGALEPVTVATGKLPSRPFTPPAAGGRKSPEIDVGTPPAIAGDSSKLSVAIVGLNPTSDALKLPAYSNPAAFSGGPTVRPDGATSDGTTRGLTVPNLFARDAEAEAAARAAAGKPNLLSRAYAAPTSSETLREALRSAQPVGTTPGTTFAAPSAAGGPVPTKVSGAPTARFDGRDVYMMAIQMPNLTSFSGSWIMWYSDRQAHTAGLAPIAAPVAHRKVDPKYFNEAIQERKEGKVQLFCVIGKDGTISGIETLKGFDPQLDESAREALAKWEFYPAMRHNEPVEVEVVVEIPFRVQPRDPAKR